MKQLLSISIKAFRSALLGSVLLSASLQAQLSVANQVLTLQVLELNSFAVKTHLLTLKNQGSPEQAAAAAATTRLAWTSNGESRKITVAREKGEQLLRISVADTRPKQTVAKNEIELQHTSVVDLIRGVSKSAGSCEIRFVASSAYQPDDQRLQKVVYTISSS